MNREKARLMQIEVCNTAKAMADGGLVAGTWGNISARIDDDYMVITPSGMDYSRLFPDQMVIVNMNTLEYEGNLKPSIEAVVHSAIYKDRPEFNGVVHTHSPWATSWAQAGRDIPAYGTTHADFSYTAVPCTRALNEVEVKGEYELNTGKVIVKYFKDNKLGFNNLNCARCTKTRRLFL